MFDGQFGQLVLNTEQTAPVRLDLYLNSDTPVRITEFKAPEETRTYGGMRKAGAGWYAYYDPHGLNLHARHDAKMAAGLARQQRSLAEFHPMSEVGKMLREIVMPLHERISDLEAQLANFDDVRRDVASLNAALAVR